MARLASTVVVTDPATGLATSLPAGSELPDWAASLVHESRLEADDDGQPEESKPSARKPAKPAADRDG